MYLRFICYKLKLIDVTTIPKLLSISHDKGNHITYYSTFKLGADKMYVIIYITVLSKSCYVFIWNAVQMNNGFYVEIYKHRKLIMYKVLQVYRIFCYPIFITWIEFFTKGFGIKSLKINPNLIVKFLCLFSCPEIFPFSFLSFINNRVRERVELI